MARPKFEITQEVIDKAESLAASGLTKQEIADCLGISYQTLNEKTKEFAEFSEAIIRGKAKGIGMMANNLVKLAKGGNAAANIFWLKAQAKWRESDDTELRRLQAMFDEIYPLIGKGARINGKEKMDSRSDQAPRSSEEGTESQEGQANCS
jgi:transcriptional regulator with XRE-family HTH domain